MLIYLHSDGNGPLRKQHHMYVYVHMHICITYGKVHE